MIAKVKRDKTESRPSRGNGDFGEAGNRIKTEVIFGQAFQLFVSGSAFIPCPLS